MCGGGGGDVQMEGELGQGTSICFWRANASISLRCDSRDQSTFGSAQVDGASGEKV